MFEDCSNLSLLDVFIVTPLNTSKNSIHLCVGFNVQLSPKY